MSLWTTSKQERPAGPSSSAAASLSSSPSCGSAFKNDPERKIVAGKLIDECGFKGFSVGGAQIAPWHANFIINPEQKARSADILELVGIVQEAVLKKQGVFPEPEIIFA